MAHFLVTTTKPLCILMTSFIGSYQLVACIVCSTSLSSIMYTVVDVPISILAMGSHSCTTTSKFCNFFGSLSSTHQNPSLTLNLRRKPRPHRLISQVYSEQIRACSKSVTYPCASTLSLSMSSKVMQPSDLPLVTTKTTEDSNQSVNSSTLSIIQLGMQPCTSDRHTCLRQFCRLQLQILIPFGSSSAVKILLQLGPTAKSISLVFYLCRCRNQPSLLPICPMQRLLPAGQISWPSSMPRMRVKLDFSTDFICTFMLTYYLLFLLQAKRLMLCMPAVTIYLNPYNIVLSNSMKEPGQANTDIGLEQQNYIFKAWRDLKDSIFNVLYVLLDGDEQQQSDEPIFGLIFESGLDYLQMLAFPFDQSIMQAWNGGDTLVNVSSLFSKLNIMSYLPGVSFNTFLIMLYALILMIVLVIIDIIYVSYSFSKKRFKFTWPLVILAKLVPLFVTIFFLPITETLLSVVSCSDNGSGYQVMESFNDVVCWQGWHLFHAAITLLFASLFVFISSVVALALFEPRMSSKKLTAKQNSTGEVVFIMNKIICQLIFSFHPFKDTWMYSLMLFCLSGWLYWTYNMNDPFFDKRASKFFRIVSSYYFWTNFMLLLSQLLGPLGFNGGLVIWISGLPFIGIIIGFEHKSNIDQLFSFNLKFKSGEQLESHLSYVLQLLQSQQQDKNSYMLVTGYIEKHKEICVEDDCPLKMTKKLNPQSSEKDDLKSKFLLQIERMYKSGIKKYPQSTRLRLSFAFFQMQRLNNKNKAYEQFSYALKTDPSFEEEFIIYRFKKIIRENLENKEKQQNTTDLIEIIRFDNHISLCEQAMIRSARLHKDFWTELKQQIPDLKRLNNIGSKITKTLNVVRENYEQIEKINNSVPEVLYCYSLYLLMVIKDNIQGRMMLELSRKIYLEKISVSNKKDDEQEHNKSPENGAYQPVITVSSKPGSIGKVLNFNSLFSELSGYQREEIVERSFEKILPEIFRDVHEQKVKQFLQSEYQSKYVNNQKQGYIKMKSGFVLPVEYKVHFKSSSQAFNVVFRNNSLYRNCVHLILDPAGLIRETSILGHAYFGLDKSILNEKDIDFKSYFGIEDSVKNLFHKNSFNPFEYTVNYQGTELPCEITLNEVSMKLRESNNESQYEDTLQCGAMLVTRDKLLGYYAKITLKGSEKIEQMSHMRERNSQMGHQEEGEENSVQSGIMQLYQDPNLFDILISNLADTKTKGEQENRFELKYKIKTMRLLNNQIKMVYDQNINADFQNNQHEQNQQDDLQIMKLNDDRYHQKIRSAINTKLNHEEVNRLKYIGLGFMFLLCGVTIAEMFLSLQVFSMYNQRSNTLFNVVDESNYLSKYLTATLDPRTNYSLVAKNISQHKVSINNEVLQISINLGNGRLETTNIRNGYMYFYSKIAQFLTLNGTLSIDHLYANFIQSIYPAVEQMDLSSTHAAFMNNIVMILFSISLFLSLIAVVCWVYTRLQIDKKKSDILLWFLDIPISYVAYLGDNCDNYLKNFVSIKEVMNKGVKIDEDPYVEDYQQVKGKGKQQEIQQQQKARKTLILKQRKLTFLSRLHCKHLKMVWLILFGMIYSVVVLSETLTLQSFENFLMDQWIFSGRSILWANSIHISEFLISTGKSDINGISVAAFSRSNLQKFENTMTQSSLHSFSSEILQKQSNSNYQQIVKAYSSVYQSDLCSYLQVNPSRCGSIVDSSLKGGYRVYTMFIRNHRPSDRDEMREANENYGSTALLSMIDIWRQNMKRQVDSAVSIASILFYVYLFACLFCFVIVWLIYLAKVNTEINEAIRMLNMIPFKLLSSSRKETRSFIIWIIREANKKKHELE